VTTELDSPYKKDVLFSLFPDGSYRLGQSSDTAIQTSISLSNNVPLLTVSDLTSHKHIARVLYPMKNALFDICQKTTIENCETNLTKPTIRILLPVDSPLKTDNTDSIITVKSDNSTVVSVDTNGSIYMGNDIQLIPDDMSAQWLSMRIVQSGRDIAILKYVTDTTQSIALKESQSPNIPILLNSAFSLTRVPAPSENSVVYGYQVIRESRGHDLDDSKNGPSHTDSLGSLSEVPWVGWSSNNTMLLSYAAGDTVWESTRFFHTYTMINMGDPVAHVDHSRPSTEIDGIDRTIGSIVERGTRSGIASFAHRDMDADGVEDLIVIYQDGYIELLLNRGGKFRSRGMVTYNRDIDAKNIVFADFIHDWYWDIVWLDKHGSFILIDNSNRKLARKNISLEWWAPLPNHISQFHIYDMDADGHDDIVYIAASGELAILYGTQTAGNFIKKILDPTLGITLSPAPVNVGGAIRTSTTPQFQWPIGVSPVTSSGTDDSMLKWEVFYQYSEPNATASITNTSPETLSGALTDISNGTTGSRVSTFIRGQYAKAYGLNIEKIYTNTTHATLYPEDHITATIRIENTSSQSMRSVEYLDTIPKIFSIKDTKQYSIHRSNVSISREYDAIWDNEYDAHFTLWDISPGETIEIIYEMVALPASYGEMIVGDLEQGMVGSDPYGDVGFKTSTTCGASMLLWLSWPNSRDYTKWTHEFGSANFPDGMSSRLTDSNKDNVPDSVVNRSREDLIKDKEALVNSNKIGYSGPVLDTKNNQGSASIGLDDNFANNLSQTAEDIANWLACGFGGGGCMNFPMNWAPLAPGSDPVLFGNPIGDWLKVDEGLPLFSALTAINIPTPGWCYQIPVVWPVSPIQFTGVCNATSGAGWYLGVNSPTNFLRIFVTPTLTLGLGAAICMGWPASLMGKIPPSGLSPLIQWGNCIVVTKPMNVCKWDGSASDGDVTAVSGLGGVGGDSWNASSCHPQANTTTEADNRVLTESIVGYLRNPNPNQLTGIYSNMSRRWPKSSNVWPLLAIGWAASWWSEASIEIDSNTKISDIGSVIKVKNKRIAAFPDFLMDWLTRQTEEITTSLFTPPSLTIMPPTSFWQNAQVDASYADFSEKLGKSYSNASFDNLKQGGTAAFDTKWGWVPGTLNAMKSAYSFIGKLPFISIKQVNIPLNIPWPDMWEIDKYLLKLKGYEAEGKNTLKNFCINDPSPECLDRRAKFQNGAFMSSIGQNLKRIEEYKKLPLKIQKYITWKERYIAQILCNINTVQQVTGWWLRDNGIRFRKWAELFVLIKAIAESWQPMLDIFADTNASCGVCRNERNNLQYWKFKLISMLIPSIPVIKFPKWPDIILDLSDIRLGINISMPNFIPRLSPIRFPSLPSLSAGSLSASISIPGLPILPPIPPLPDLPDLPSLPRVKLPDLPPPPKIPKIAGSISAFLSILKLIAKMYCYYQKTILIPEWQAGDVIAQRTERQGTSPFDFINLSLPQYSLPSLREIRVASHVNYELRSDFISEFARSAVRPINEFQTDLQSAIPSSIGTNMAIPSVRIDARPGAYIDTNSSGTLPDRVAKMVENIDRDKNIFLEIADFAKLLGTELDAPELSQAHAHLQRWLRVTELESQELQDTLTQYNNTKFSLLRDYLSRENDSNAELQNIVDLISHDIAWEPHQLIANMVSGSNRATWLLDRLNQFETQHAQESSIPASASAWLDQMRDSLSERISRMMSANTIPDQASTSMDTSSPVWYSPNYQGIYIKTPSGVQTRLFDYIDPVTAETRVDTIDIDGDGDLDYIYLLDGILYVKYNWSRVPNKIIDTTTKISSIAKNDPAPYVPDYFYEDISTPHNLNYSFVSSSQTETEWRVDFYDQYVEWDNIDIGSHDPRASSKTSIDMFLDTSPTPLGSDTGILTHVVSRSLRSVADPDSFALEWRRIDIYTGSVSLSLSPWRVLYTGDRSVTISYKNEKTPVLKSQILSPHMWYEFSTPTEISTNGGQLYLIGAKDNSRYVYSDDLIGMPILPDMRLYGSDAGSVIRDTTHDRDMSLPAGTTYITYALGARADHYNISLPYVDGYYYARIENLTDKKLDRAWVTLLSPQAASDDGDPVIDLPTEIRLPIYTTHSYPLSDVLTDLSAATLTVDSDITTDTDNNGVFDDDFTAKSSTVAISSSDIIFGSFIQPGRYNMMLKAVDALGNMTTMPLIVTAYTPLPQIQSVTSTGWVLGTISESLGGIPTHLFRVRSGEQPTLLASGSALSNLLGRFSTGSFFASPEIVSMTSNSQIATMTTRGVFTLQPWYHTEVASATATDPMRILTVDQTGSISHIHTLILPDDTRFIDSSRLANSSTGVIMTPTAGVTRITWASQKDTSIPGGQYITDMSYRPLAAIARDGNIYILDPTTTLRYRSKDWYMSIELIRQGIVVATIEYRIDFFYTMR
jgi:FG-GAP-like repeat